MQFKIKKMSQKERAYSLNRETINRTRKLRHKNTFLDLVTKKIKYTKKLLLLFFKGKNY
jgi:hypothetical protein